MDQHSESGESPPSDPQPASKTRKGFKLFGKRKPGSGVGSIFSMRSKGDGNNPNKSSIARSNTQDGLGESVAQEFEQETEKRHPKDLEPEVGERDEQEIAGEEDEITGYDGMSYSVPPRPSISSVTSAKSLGFLSMLRGGRRGGRERHAHTVSQPSMKQRRGLKGLFGSVPWHQRDKEPKEQSPPSPLLMTSRTNSVEIIKEDLTLTPTTPPRTMNSPEQEQDPDTANFSPVMSATISERSDAGLAAASENMCGSNLDVLEVPPLPVPTTEPTLDPAVDRLSSLMADISLLISLDSFTGCGDIIADVEAEWGKASSAAEGGGTRAAAGAKPSSTPTTFDAAPGSTTVTPMTTSYMSSVPSTKLTSHSISPATTFAISSTFNQPSPIICTNIKPNLMSTSNLTPNPTPSPPTPYPVSPSSISSSFTTAAVSKPSPVAPPISAASKPSPVAPPISAASKPSPVAPPTSAASKSSPVAPPTSAASKSSPVAPPISAASKPSPVAPPISAAYKPSPAAPPTSAASNPSPVAPPISAASKPSPVAPPISAASKPSPVAPPISAASKPSPIAPPISAASKPSPVAPPISAPSKPSPVTPPISAASKPSPVAPPISAASKPSPVAPPISAASKPCPVAPPISAASKPSPVTPPTSAASKPSSETSALASSSKPTPVSQSPSPAAFASFTMSSKLGSTEAISFKTFSHANTFQNSVGPTHPHTMTPIPDLPPSPDLVLGQTPLPAVAQSPLPALVSPPKASSSNSVSLPKATSSNTDFPSPQTSSSPTITPAIVSASKPPLDPPPVSVSSPATAHSPSIAPTLAAVVKNPIICSQSKTGSENETSVNEDKNTATPNGMDVARAKSSKQDDQQGASQDVCLNVPQSDKKSPPKKTAGLSKIPVVGGGRPAKLQVRKAMPSDDEECWDVSTHGYQDQSPCLSQQRMESRDSVSDHFPDMEVTLSIVGKSSPEENPLELPKIATSLSRDSKIPVKQGVSIHAHPSQIPVAKDPLRTKIPVSKVPVSKVPVRRSGCNKTTTASPKPVTDQLRK